jgi:antitoxin PrlF
MSTLTSKGQITIPKRLRDRLGLEPGDVFEVSADDRGQVVLRPQENRSEAGGFSRLPSRRPMSLEEMVRTVRRRFHARTSSH